MAQRRGYQAQPATDASSPATPSRPPQHQAAASSLSDRAQEAVALRAQKHREHLLLGQMEHLADTLCQQYMHMAADPTTGRIGGGANSTGPPRSMPTTPEAVPVDIIRQQIENMQFHIQHALQQQQQQQQPEYDGGGASPRVPTGAVPIPRPPAVLTTQRLLPALIHQQPAHMTASSQWNAAASANETARYHRTVGSLGHATTVKTPQDGGASGGRDAFDLPSSLRKQQPSPRRVRGAARTGGGSGASTPRQRWASEYTAAGGSGNPNNDGEDDNDHGGYDYDDELQRQYAALPYVPNYNAVRSMVGEEHGMLVGHVQPLLDVMTHRSFGALDCMLDGNTRCLSHRRPPTLNAVALGLREQPPLHLGASPRGQDTLTISSIIARRAAAAASASTAASSVAGTEATPRPSPRDAVAQRALEKLHHPLPQPK